MGKIQNYINDVRHRPEAEKQRAVLTWTIICASIIFIIWVTTFTLSFVSNANDQARLRAEAEQMAAKAVTQASVVTTTSPATTIVKKGLLPTIGQLLSDGVDSITNGFWVIGGMLH